MIGVYIIQDDLFRYANPRFAEMFGYTQEEICGASAPTT
jgi:PAS domain S-box-containing protein